MKISFMHCGSLAMASYRYRAFLPRAYIHGGLVNEDSGEHGERIDAFLNNPRADIHIYAKPIPQDVNHAARAKSEGKKVIVDICDLHFDQPHYRQILDYADIVTTNTNWSAQYIKEDFGIGAYVIPEPYEYEEQVPHCYGNRLLWFGSSGNYDSLERVKRQIEGYPLTVVSNVVGAIPWSKENLTKAFSESDIVIIPETAPYKSANRAVEAIRCGCFVVAEPHPSLDIPGIYIGNIRKGIEWTLQNLNEANEMTSEAQSFIRERLSPRTLVNAWRTVIRELNSISVPEKSTGTTG